MSIIQCDKRKQELASYVRYAYSRKGVAWDIDNDVFQSRTFGQSDHYMPNLLSGMHSFPTLSPEELVFINQIQGRTYANIIGLLDRFSPARVVRTQQDETLTDGQRRENLLRSSCLDLQHQKMFWRAEILMAAKMPAGYQFVADGANLAQAFLDASPWTVWASAVMGDMVAETHFNESKAQSRQLSPLFADIFRFHWLEKSQLKTLDTREWRREDAKLPEGGHTACVTELIGLLTAMDDLLKVQASADAEYFCIAIGRPVGLDELVRIRNSLLSAYRRQHLATRIKHPHVELTFAELAGKDQARRLADVMGQLSAKF